MVVHRAEDCGPIRASATSSLLALLESRRLSYIVVTRLYEPVRSLIRQTTRWQRMEIAGTEVAQDAVSGVGLEPTPAGGAHSPFEDAAA